MRKQPINSVSEPVPLSTDMWLNLRDLAIAEITSEDVDHPIESALIPGRGPGWRAAKPGKQTIRLVLDEPMSIERILLRFEERERGRTQEFALRCVSQGLSHREIVRQQYVFSPPATIQELEDYSVKLSGVIALELQIVPDISGGGAYASLAEMRLA